MTYGQIRLIRGFLALALVAFTSLLAYQLHRSGESKRSRLAGERHSVAPTTQRTEQIQHRTLDDQGQTVFELVAAERIGLSGTRNRFRQVEIRFKAGKEKIPLTVTAETCTLDTATQAAHFEGNVVVSGERSLRIESDALDYDPRTAEVVSDTPVRFSRQGVEGTAGAMRSSVAAATVDLLLPVWVKITPKGGQPTEIRSRTAAIRRRESLIQFIDDVVVEGENRRLKANNLQLYLNPEETGLTQLLAFERVELTLEVPLPGGGSALAEPGRWRLKTEALEVVFRPDGSTVERVRATEGGELVVEPTPSSPGVTPARREVQGNLLAFDFNSEGRLTDFRGRGGVTLRLQPEGAAESEIRTVTARSFESSFDPASGELIEMHCYQAVSFSRGEVRAEAEEGVFRARSNRLNLSGSPRLWDSRAALEANVVNIDVATGDLDASGNVRSTQSGSAGGPSGMDFFSVGESGGAVYFLSDDFSYQRASDTTTYVGSARGVRGENRIFADRIVLKGGGAEVEANGSVRTHFLQKDKKGEPQRLAAVSDFFSYRRQEGMLRYREGVRLTTPDLTLAGQRLYLKPTAEGRIESIQVQGKVDIQLASSRVRGDEATYLAASEQMQVFGEKATMQDGDKLTEGKELTFFLAGDRILVDGREQIRTRSVYTSKPRPL
jgi:LPS export ABC transporter protein LptC